MKNKLVAMLEEKQAMRSATLEEVDKAENVEELRGLQEKLQSIMKEITELEEMIAEIDEEKEEERTAIINNTIPEIVKTGNVEKRKGENKMEYREAFQQLVTKGVPIPAELRADETTKTTDGSYAIPKVVTNQIIDKLESTGNILGLVTKTAFPAGVSIPTSSVKPSATWVSEGATSDKQKKTLGVVTFTHFKLRCEIAMTLEMSQMSVTAFEKKFVDNVVEAMTKAIENAIINGAYDNTTSAFVGPKGILNETAPTGQTVELANNAVIGYDTLVDAESKLPLAYESGAVWFMSKKTFMSFVGLVDTQKQPIARINYGIDGKPERMLLGRQVILNDYMLDYPASAPNTNTTFAFLFNPKDYVLNTNYNMGISKKQDWDTEDMLTKAVMIVDGKVIDKGSLVILSKKA
jgi:HK97 family phage major capsid protein